MDLHNIFSFAVSINSSFCILSFLHAINSDMDLGKIKYITSCLILLHLPLMVSGWCKIPPQSFLPNYICQHVSYRTVTFNSSYVWLSTPHRILYFTHKWNSRRCKLQFVVTKTKQVQQLNYLGSVLWEDEKCDMEILFMVTGLLAIALFDFHCSILCVWLITLLSAFWLGSKCSICPRTNKLHFIS